MFKCFILKVNLCSGFLNQVLSSSNVVQNVLSSLSAPDIVLLVIIWCDIFPLIDEGPSSLNSAYTDIQAAVKVLPANHRPGLCLDVKVALLASQVSNGSNGRAGSKSQCIRILYLKVKYLYLTCPSCIDPSSWLVLDLHRGCDLTCFSSIISK